MQDLPHAAEGATEPPSGFGAIALDERLRAAIDSLGFDTPTPVQLQAIPALLQGRDVIGRARTGSGKTAAFGLPLLERVKEGGASRALVLTPTRELALQVSTALRSFAKGLKGLRIVTIYGGAPYPPQLKALANGATVIVGTPGRVIDHLDRGSLDLSALEVLVLDEADEMLRMGFIDEVEKLIAATPKTRQVALFSATMPPRIRAVAQAHLSNPLELDIESRGVTVDHIEQRWMSVPQRFKLDALVRVLRATARGTTLVFARTRAACHDIAERLSGDGFNIEALHGDLTQAARESVMRRMRSQDLRVVIATDVAARGLDVEHIQHVINFDLPDDLDGYVHRIGRTGRAGRAGMAISFITPRERTRVRELERRLSTQITPLPVPGDSEIAALQWTALGEQIAEVASGPRVAEQHLSRVLETTGLDLPGLAVAALTLLARREGISLEPPADDGPPAWSLPPRREVGRRNDDGPRPERGTRRPASGDEPDVQLFFPLGKLRGVRPGDLVGLLANEGGVSGAMIGRIDVYAQKSFVSLPASVAAHVLETLPRVCLRGVDVPVSLAHTPQPERPTGRPTGPRTKPERAVRRPPAARNEPERAVRRPPAARNEPERAGGRPPARSDSPQRDKPSARKGPGARQAGKPR